jgi:hypothetical protein
MGVQRKMISLNISDVQQFTRLLNIDLQSNPVGTRRDIGGGSVNPLRLMFWSFHCCQNEGHAGFGSRPFIKEAMSVCSQASELANSMTAKGRATPTISAHRNVNRA